MILILTTVPSESLGEEIARALVGERLAACVTIGAPMTSIYRCKGDVERETERQLTIKTTNDRITAIQDRIKALHSYELPEFIVIEAAGGSDAYLNWVATESRNQP